jgi:hypothetical protein
MELPKPLWNMFGMFWFRYELLVQASALPLTVEISCMPHSFHDNIALNVYAVLMEKYLTKMPPGDEILI